MQVDAFVFRGPPEAIYEDVVSIVGFAIHRDIGLFPRQPVTLVKGRELGTLVGIDDLGRTDVVDDLVQPPMQHLALSVLGMCRVRALRVNQSIMAIK